MDETFDKNDLRFMRRAFVLARRGLGFVEPNPAVGCVLVQGKRVVGEGWHERFGGAHAEVNAIAAAGARARGATAYVTLEPCNHTGKTGPCTEALLAARVKRVVVACEDPSKKVAGRGIAKLRKAGVQVQVGLLAERGRELIAPFAKVEREGIPYVIGKWAATIDGAIATASGDSRWISNPRSRQLVHKLRARMDAILVGAGTVLADDPLLTARDVPVRRIARRVVIDPTLRTPADCQLVRTIDQAPVTVFCGSKLDRTAKTRRDRLENLGVEIVTIDITGPGTLDLRAALSHLWQRHQAMNVLVEGGGTTMGHFVEQQLADEMWCFIGPRILGDSQAVRPVQLSKPVRTIRASALMQLRAVRRIGDDVMLQYGTSPL